MKRSARTTSLVYYVNILGSAFAANRQPASSAVTEAPVQRDDEEVVDNDAETPEELTDEEIEFVNSFDVLSRKPEVGPPPAKKLKQRTGLPELVWT